MTESAWRRAWRDSEQFRESPFFFWGGEVIGAALLAGGSALLFLDADSTRWEQALYPALGVIGGLAGTYCLVVVYNLFQAPYRQRDEARVDATSARAELKRERDATEAFFSELHEDGRQIKWKIEDDWEAGDAQAVKVWEINVAENLEKVRPQYLAGFWNDGFPEAGIRRLDGTNERNDAYREITIRLHRLKEEVIDKLIAEHAGHYSLSRV